MAPVFIFADQVRNAVRAGKKEIEVPEGARISSAAADLIKEHRIKIKTVAPSPAAPEASSEVEERPSAPPVKKSAERKTETPARKTEENLPPENPAEISGDEIEKIINRVIERFYRLKGREIPQTTAGSPAKPEVKSDSPPDEDDLIICRCEEITRGEIKEVIRNGIQTLNGVKRITRAGMGLCQGQTCQNLVARILAEELGIGMAEIDPTTARGPVRPLSLEVFANS